MATCSFRKTTLSHAQKTVLAMSRAQYLEDIRATRPADKLFVGVCIFRMDAHSSRPSVLLLRRSSSSSSPPSALSSSSATTPESTAIFSSPFSSPSFPSTPPTSPYSSSYSPFSPPSSIRWGRSRYDEEQQDYTSSGYGNRHGNSCDYGDGNGYRNGEGMWELPGGKVLDEDFCISAAVARQVAEQTGLQVVRVLGALQDVRRVVEVRILDWDDDGVGIFTAGGSSSGDLSVLDGATLTSATGSLGSGRGSGRGVGGIRGSTGSTQSRRSPIHNPQLVLRKECLQLNYAVLVKNHEDLAVKSPEHEELVWASFSRAEALPMPEEIRTVVHQGLAFAGEFLF
ncbi:uncharacterized protein F4812DRAFT_135449 [Daldinia caldariorum]|uniref:uncharacterized protein n=1 Tax=Daldinia caldariorum TaxID=326644 RepID=UPI002008487E|nr:uncharacterized protein F4812DRAFT_135449 [Daldinia caldariorum]KAI1465175.1 hypothetical protein F4812DRAFT_135449 [Daldinia caldariorum]